MQHTTRIAAAAFLSAVTLFTACKKDDNNTDQLASLTKATVTGKVFAETVDTPGAAAIQYAPSGTTIQAWIDTKDLVLYASSTTPYAKRYYTTTVDANGSYSLSIDVSKYQSATVHIESPSFASDVTKKTFPDSIYKVREVFHQVSMMPVSVTTGTTQVTDVTFMY